MSPADILRKHNSRAEIDCRPSQQSRFSFWPSWRGFLRVHKIRSFFQSSIISSYFSELGWCQEIVPCTLYPKDIFRQFRLFSTSSQTIYCKGFFRLYDMTPSKWNDPLTNISKNLTNNGLNVFSAAFSPFYAIHIVYNINKKEIVYHWSFRVSLYKLIC